jgi:general secretion pathway protein K
VVRGASMTPEAFAARTVDWRDQDSDLSEQGAEAAEYYDAGRSFGPADRRFRSVEELRFVLGLSRADLDRLRPFVTVYTGRGTIDPLSASETVLLAIPGMNRGLVQTILRARRQGLGRLQIAALVGQASEFLSTADSTVYRVGVQVRLRNGFTDAVEAVIVAQPEDGSGYRVAAWSRSAAAESRDAHE